MNGVDLLDTARTVLREQLLGELPPEHRLTALMIANAMAIAGRELSSGETLRRAHLDSLGALLGGVDEAGLPRTDDTIERLNRALCAEIRAGRADPGTPLHERAYAHLLSVQRARVLISNPRYPGVAGPTGLPTRAI
jgi:hypothetical protein